mgnify:CR=1 FL=1
MKKCIDDVDDLCEDEVWDWVMEADDRDVRTVLKRIFEGGDKQDLWSDIACMGYCSRAMEIEGFSEADCLRVHAALMNALREMTVEEAEEYEQEKRQKLK